MDTGSSISNGKNNAPVTRGGGDGDAPCWSRIGIDGDGTCPELAVAVHCRNCPVYSDAGRSLLDRPLINEYRAEWTARLASATETQQRTTHAVVIFSLQSEFLALPAPIFNEIAAMRRIRRVPGVHNKLLLGMVNIRGELQLCISLHALLGFETGSAIPEAGSGRLMLIQQGTDAWAFPVDDVHGTYRYNPESLSPPPATVEKSRSRFSRGTLEWEGKRVGCLDETMVFSALKGSMA